MPRSWIALPFWLHSLTPQTRSCPLIATGVVPVGGVVAGGVVTGGVVAGGVVVGGVITGGVVAGGVVTVGDEVVGVGDGDEPSQVAPLIWHEVGRPVPFVMKPNEVDAPA